MWTALTSARKKGGADTGPSPVDRRKTGSKHHLICDGHGTLLKVITTAANVNDVTQTLALVDSIPPVAGRPRAQGWSRRARPGVRFMPCGGRRVSAASPNCYGG
ncbi:transposase [Streptomyces phaeochromogenes]|uniref:transposase n=1 Tax=Streptomyces phaeochromogenes TaxID=1923 RepID=UPI003863697B